MGDTNTFIPEGIYALANPSSGITALNMNCECNLFGRKTYFNMTSLKTFDIIDDAPVEKEVEKEEGSWWGNLITGIIATAALAACAIAVVATGGAALGAIMLAGAAIGTGIVTVSAAITDAKSGQARSWTQFLGDLVTGGITGAVAGATIYGLWTAAPIVGQAFGIQASMLFGGVTEFTAITIPKIFAGFGKFLIGTQGVRYLNEITSIGSGQNWLLDHMFGGNQENYTTAGMCLDLFSMGYVQIARDNAGLAKPKISRADRKKLSKWKYPPPDDLYLKYKEVYDNPKYFNQKTGDVIYPGTGTDPNIAGFTNGEFKEITLTPGQTIDRYGSNPTGQYFSPEGTPYGSRALPPFMEKETCTVYEVLKPFKVKAGEICPWFDEPRLGTQFFTDFEIIDLYTEMPVKANVKTLIDNKYLKIIKIISP